MFTQWLLLELARHPEYQTKLREELSQFGGDLSYDQLWSSSVAPYLDAVVKESLRLHAPLGETTRQVTEQLTPVLEVILKECMV
jgi:cytochrome P450